MLVKVNDCWKLCPERSMYRKGVVFLRGDASVRALNWNKNAYIFSFSHFKKRFITYSGNIIFAYKISVKSVDAF